ncbi:ATP-binding protein [Microbulbifer thermotolerans]|uniref:histidine kinase n=1 Tax=Microbulbifer thermotolerans TaxID=252514 RepID=A0A143HR40_MICTH|nr:ATP-binding protein [Microbulbifer thermotolerans]AMX03951.1 hypothetical protein A3224_16340 [Microbulbifer thermotolerans]
MKFSVFYKWLLSLLLTLGVIVTLILLLVNWSFQRGFVSYARQNEILQIERVASLLADAYKRRGSWQFLRDDYRQWAKMLESAGIVVPPQMREQPPRRQQQEVADIPAPSSGPDLMAASIPLAHRIVLVDTRRDPIAGPRIPVREDHWYAVRSGGKTVAWIGLQPIEIITDELARSFIEQQRTNLVWILLAGLLLSLLVAAAWARWFLRPIQRVMTAARQLAAGNYATRVTVRGRNELSELAANFNQLAQTLARNEQIRRQWIVDISHELRTPIAVIGGEIEALLDGIRKPTPERMAALHSEIEALGKLVDDLHLLSLADQATLQLVQEPVDLTALVQTQIAHFEPRLQQQKLSLTLDADHSEPLLVLADARRLSQLVGNLLENSLRYTDPKGEIRILIDGDGERIVLEVQDSPPGVSETELEKIFDRLYRVDRSRSRALGGSGLGLAICREIVLVHGGQIRAAKSPLGGLAIQISLPRERSLR